MPDLKPSFFWTEKKKPEAPFHYKTTASFYASPPWGRMRLYKLSLNPLCEQCQKNGLIVAAAEVHHIIEISEDPDLALDINNLESLCKRCHSQESYKHIKDAKKPKQTAGIVNLKFKLQNKK